MSSAEMWELSDRRYTLPNSQTSGQPRPQTRNMNAEDLHEWSIYRQNLNSDFTDSALGSDERSPLPYGNFQLSEQTIHSILSHPRLGPGGSKSELSSNMYSYLKFGLPRVFPQNHPSYGTTPGNKSPFSQGTANTMVDYDEENEEEHHFHSSKGTRANKGREGNLIRVVSKSETDLRDGMISNRFRKPNGDGPNPIRSANSEIITTNGGHRDFPHHNGSQISLVSRNSRHPTPSAGKPSAGPTLFYSAMKEGTGQALEPVFKYPHFQVRGLCYESSVSGAGRKEGRGINSSSKSRILEGISFDLRGGELMAVMTTTSMEGTILLDVLAGRRSLGEIGDYISGEFLLNGNPVSLERLGSRVAYVRRDYRLHPDITVIQTIKFYALFKSPVPGRESNNSASREQRIHVLLEELGLTAVRGSLVETLTSSERQRLTVACQLILDTDIVLLDNPTKGMDIFDTFFLVDYLRGWSGVNGRIILMTIHPPTFEIFSMFTKVALISTGRTMFYGYRREMLPYFAFIEYPCPGFKNPSDYYIDLVTLDDLSNEALLESSQRIETLADSYRRKQESFIIEGGQSTHLPLKVSTAGPFQQIFNIWIYMVSYSFPWNLVRWLVLMIMSAGLSILIGAIYWNIRLNVPQDQNSGNDRSGFHWTLMTVTPWPLLLVLSSQDLTRLQYTTRDVEERLYTRATYIIAKILGEFPYLLTIFLAYIIPAYVMGGLAQEPNDMDSFYAYIGYMILYLCALRSFLLAATHTFKIEGGVSVSGFVFLALALSGGYSLHPTDLGSWVTWVRYLSPTYWILQPLLRNEFQNITLFSCPNNPVITQTGAQNIMTKLECGLKSGGSALEVWGLSESWPTWFPILASVGFIFVALTSLVMVFILRRTGPAIPQTEKP